MTLRLTLSDVFPRRTVSALLALMPFALGCHSGPAMTLWTTGEPHAPRDVVAVYRAVLDDIFPPGLDGPSLLVIEGMTKPSRIEFDVTSKHPHRMPDGKIAPFNYRIPIIFLDTLSLRDLVAQSRKADSMSQTARMTDLLYRQRSAAPFIARFPGAWGKMILGRVGLNGKLDSAVVDVWYFPVGPEGFYGHEFFRLGRNNGEWRVIERDSRRYADAAIQPTPIRPGLLHAWVDSASLPLPKRVSVRGFVRDSVSGAPVPNLAIRIEATPLGKHGELVRGKAPEPWGTVFTNSAGEYVIPHPPSGPMWLEAQCPPSRDVEEAPLGYADLTPTSGPDTVINFLVRFTSCAERAPEFAKEAERHRQDVVRAKVEAAARAVQGNIHGTVRDASTGRAVPRVPIRVDKRWGPTFTDSLGHFWLWGFAPGQRTIIVHCPARRSFFGGKVAKSITIQAPPRMNDTFDIAVDMRKCNDPDPITVKIRTKGVWSIGFEDGFFTPCKPFTQIPLGAYEDWSHTAYLSFSSPGIHPPGGWPDIKPTNGYKRVFLVADGDLIGPGSYGHLGIATYLLKVTRVLSAKPASKTSCRESDR